MAVRTREEILELVRSSLGDDTSDETLGLIEDISDTLSDLSSRASDTTDWRTRYEENDASWRQRYRDRFFGGNPDEEEDSDDEPSAPMTFEDLFK